MLPFLTEQFANPSGSHRFAREVRKAIDEARDDVADVLGCRPGEVIFTGGGTEADNTAIFGTLDRRRRRGRVPGRRAPRRARTRSRPGTASSSASTRPAASISTGSPTALRRRPRVRRQRDGRQQRGRHDHRPRRGRRRRRRARAAARAAHRRGAGACWLDLRAVTPHVDLLSLSAHKFGGPKGVGVLGGPRSSSFAPLLIGGGQERERRSGTHNVAGIVAMAEALRLTDAERVDARRSASPRCATARRRAAGRARRRVTRPCPRRARWPARRTSASTASRTRRCCTCSTRPGCAPARRRRAPAGRWSRRTCWPRWACPRDWPAVRCA